MIVPLPRSGPICHIPQFISVNYHPKKSIKKNDSPRRASDNETSHGAAWCGSPLFRAARFKPTLPQPTPPSSSSSPSLQSASKLTADSGRWMVRSGGSSGSTGSSWTDEWLDGFGARIEYQQEKCQRPHSERVHIFSPLHETSHRLAPSVTSRQLSGFNCMDGVLTEVVLFY